MPVVNTPNPHPSTYTQMVDMYFLEHRAKLVDIAAFMDRLDRANPNPNPSTDEDYRMAALRAALTILADGQGNRAKRVLEQLSDPTTAPTDAPAPPAAGAYPPNDETRRTRADSNPDSPGQHP